MFQTYLSRFIWFSLLLLLQVLVFNHVHIAGYATPMPYVYFLLILSSDTPKWAYVLLGFVLGFCVDLFGSTPGMAAASMTATGLAMPWLLSMFRPADRGDDVIEPSVKSMEWWPFVRYALSAVLINTLLFVLIEAFSFFNYATLLINFAGSSLLTLLLVLAMEQVRMSGKKK